MAKCNQLTSLSFKGLRDMAVVWLLYSMPHRAAAYSPRRSAYVQAWAYLGRRGVGREMSVRGL